MPCACLILNSNTVKHYALLVTDQIAGFDQESMQAFSVMKNKFIQNWIVVYYLIVIIIPFTYMN